MRNNPKNWDLFYNRLITMPAVFETAIRLVLPTTGILIELFALKIPRDRVNNLFRGSHPALLLSYGTNTRRKPMLLLQLSGLLLLRFAVRQFCALLFQLPPRTTRFEPSIIALILTGIQPVNSS